MPFWHAALERCRFNDLSDRDFVDGLYRNLLGRPAEPAGLEMWVAQLESGKDRAFVIRHILGSAEFRQHHPYGAVVQ